MPHHPLQYSLESIWLGLLDRILVGGVRSENDRIELHNVEVHMETLDGVTPLYTEIFGMATLDAVLQVYSPQGNPEYGKNYYEKIYNSNGVNQIEQVVRVLREEPQSQSAAVLLDDEKKKPCVMLLHFKVMSGALTTFVYFKSSDVPKKLLPDLIAIKRLQAEVAAGVECPIGATTLYIGNAHIYVRDWGAVKNLFAVSRFASAPLAQFPTLSVQKNWEREAEQWKRYLEDPNHYVNFEAGYARFTSFLQRVLENRQMSVGAALDLGCGIGTIAQQLRMNGYTTSGLDISTKMRDEAVRLDPQGTYLAGNCLDMPFSSESFVLVASRGVLLSHVGVPYVRQAFAEIHRVLTPRGFAVLDYVTHFEVKDGVKALKKACFSRAEIEELASDTGFTVVEHEGVPEQRCNIVVLQKV